MAPEKAETKECGTRLVFGSNDVEGAEPGDALKITIESFKPSF